MNEGVGMLMNPAEAALIDSPARRRPQRYEAHLLTKLGGRTPGGRFAELGCGPAIRQPATEEEV